MLVKKEVKSRELLNRSDNKSILRSLKQQPKFQKIIDDEAYFLVSSGNGRREHVVVIQSDKINDKISTQELKDIIKNEDIKVGCSCENFLYNGYKYILYNMGAGIDRETRPPNKKNPNKIGCLCKHIISVLNTFK